MKRRRAKSATRSGSTDAKLIDAMCVWFAANARDLPWRRKRTGYTALVSESMLQQTQVSRVVEVYRRFMKRFPTVKSLAAADEQDVLAMWQGMGYYRRARNLHAAARMVVERFGGRVPSSVVELRQLPGVGRYTAGAIASIVFERKEPIVDGNVLRVLARLRGKRGSPTDAEMVTWTWGEAQSLVAQASQPGVFNEGLMELGATVCVPSPSTPKCDVCPVAKWCEAKKQGIAGEIPMAGRRTKPRAAHHHAIVVRHPDRSALIVEQRPATGMWANMWQVPTIEAEMELKPADLIERLSLPVERFEPLATFRHTTTHRAIRFHVFRAVGVTKGGTWHGAKHIARLPMSNPQRRIVMMAMEDRGSSGSCKS